MTLIRAGLAWVSGHLRHGHLEMEIGEKYIEEFKGMSKEEQKEYLRENGELIIDDVSVNDRGDLGECEICE